MCSLTRHTEDRAPRLAQRARTSPGVNSTSALAHVKPRQTHRSGTYQRDGPPSGRLVVRNGDAGCSSGTNCGAVRRAGSERRAQEARFRWVDECTQIWVKKAEDGGQREREVGAECNSREAELIPVGPRVRSHLVRDTLIPSSFSLYHYVLCLTPSLLASVSLAPRLLPLPPLPPTAPLPASTASRPSSAFAPIALSLQTGCPKLKLKLPISPRILLLKPQAKLKLLVSSVSNVVKIPKPPVCSS
ncbi:hypothetical protein B0H11DRAFT_1943131 [Mycena galericulata]|nr:hypothetical protein B0H11DRAFT_1943131 [Mycena galericulata]